MKKIFAVIIAIAIAASAFVMVTSAKDADTWLCEEMDSYSTGWWMHVFDSHWEFNAKFTTPNAFDGFYLACFACPGEGVTPKFNLLYESGKVLDSVDMQIIGDHNVAATAVTIPFSKAYAAGTYTIQILGTDNADYTAGNGPHFVIGSANAASISVEISGNCNTNDMTLAAPAILLRGASAPSGSTPSTGAKPSLLITAEALVSLSDSAQVISGLTYELKSEGGMKFVTFTASNNDPWVVFGEAVNVGAENKYVVVKYRTADQGVQTIDFYLQIAEPHARGAQITADGEWHYTILNLETPFPENMASLWDGTIARFDVLNGSVEGTSLDIAEVAFFSSEADANAYTSGGSASNPGSGDAAVIAIAAVGCIALAGVVVAKKVK